MRPRQQMPVLMIVAVSKRLSGSDPAACCPLVLYGSDQKRFVHGHTAEQSIQSPCEQSGPLQPDGLAAPSAGRCVLGFSRMPSFESLLE